MWKQKERSRIRAVQMDSLRSLLGIRRMDKVPSAWIKELCGVTKGVAGRIDWPCGKNGEQMTGLLRGSL